MGAQTHYLAILLRSYALHHAFFCCLESSLVTWSAMDYLVPLLPVLHHLPSFLVCDTVDIPCTSSSFSWCSALLAGDFVNNGLSCFRWAKSTDCSSPLAFLSLFFVVRGFRNNFARSTIFIWHSSSPVPSNTGVFDNSSHPKYLAKSGNASSGLSICRIPPNKSNRLTAQRFFCTHQLLLELADPKWVLAILSIIETSSRTGHEYID